MRAGSHPHLLRARRSNRGHKAIARACGGHRSCVREFGRGVWASTCTEVAIDRLPARGNFEAGPDASVRRDWGEKLKRLT